MASLSLGVLKQILSPPQKKKKNKKKKNTIPETIPLQPKAWTLNAKKKKS